MRKKNESYNQEIWEDCDSLNHSFHSTEPCSPGNICNLGAMWSSPCGGKSSTMRHGSYCGNYDCSSTYQQDRNEVEAMDNFTWNLCVLGQYINTTNNSGSVLDS